MVNNKVFHIRQFWKSETCHADGLIRGKEVTKSKKVMNLQLPVLVTVQKALVVAWVSLVAVMVSFNAGASAILFCQHLQ
jgi:hypothetical protein